MLVNPKYTEPPLTVPLDAPTEVSAEAENAQVTIKWTDPKNKYATPEGEEAQDPQQLVAVWDHTVLVRKVGSNPTGPSDGTVVVSTTVRNQYQTTGYTDTGLVNDTSYHYGVFSFNEDGVASAGAFVEATPLAGTPLSQLTEGTIIKINENGKPVEFYLAKHSYEPDLNGAGRELLVRKDVFDYRRWNDTEVNTWANSSMLSWLNSGYKMILGTNVQKMIATTTYRYTPGNGDKSVTTRADAVFLMSLTELGKSALYVNTEGSALPIAAILQTIPQPGPNQDGQWTRSPNTQYNSAAVNLGYTGLVSTNKYVTTDHYASRPCFTLPSTALVDADLNLIES